MEVGFRKSAKQYYSDPLLANMLEAVFQKYQGQNGIRGNAKFLVNTMEEADRLQDFFGYRIEQMIRPGSEIQIHLKVFEEELALGYKIGIVELFEILYDKQLLTRLEQRQLKQEVWIQLFARVDAYFKEEYKVSLSDGPFCHAIFNWFERLKNANAAGYRILKSVVSKESNGEEDLRYCMEALWYLFGDKESMLKDLGGSVPWVRLSWLANYITKDAHAFDWKKPAGRLLWHALFDIDMQKIKCGDKKTNENLIVPEFMKRRQVYRDSGIMDDDISSHSHIFAPPFIYGSAPRTLNLREIESCQVWPKYSALYVLENPQVFSILVDETVHFLETNGLSFEQLQNDFPALVCTSGQARNAAKLFISKCIDSNPDCVIYYSGDFDLPGLQMKIGLEQLGNVKIWRMDSTTYLKYIDSRNVPLSKQDRKILNEKTPGRLAKVMARIGVKVYQEDDAKGLKDEWLQVINRLVEVG